MRLNADLARSVNSDLISADVGCGLAGVFLSPAIDFNGNAEAMRPGIDKLTLLSEL